MNILNSLLTILISGFLGYFCGIFRERNFIKWRENRQALQSAYAYCDVLKVRIEENSPFTKSLYKQLEKLKYKQNFNIQNEIIFLKLRAILESPIYDPITHTYNQDIKDKFIKSIEEILPIIKTELNKIRL